METLTYNKGFAVVATTEGGETFFAGHAFGLKADAEAHATTINTWIGQMRGMGGELTLPTGDGRQLVVTRAEVVAV